MLDLFCFTPSIPQTPADAWPTVESSAEGDTERTDVADQVVTKSRAAGGRGRKGHGKVVAGAPGTQPSRKRKTPDDEGNASVKSKIQGSEPEAQPRARSVRQKKPGQRVAEAQLSQLVLELMSN